MPVVEVVGLVGGRADDLDGVLITRHLEFSLPYRLLFGDTAACPTCATSCSTRSPQLLARLHLAGFFWGDCSLSNTLFRRDAGALSAYLVDAETGELHPQLSDGQREHDLLIADGEPRGRAARRRGRRAAARRHRPVGDRRRDRAPLRGAVDELMHDEVLRARRALPDRRAAARASTTLGFDVEEIELVAEEDGSFRLRLDPHVVEPGHHRRRLLTLTGLDAQENQARRMLNDLARFRAALEEEEGKPVPESVAAYRWRAEVFEPAVAARAAPSCGASARPPRSSTRSSTTAGTSPSRRART